MEVITTTPLRRRRRNVRLVNASTVVTTRRRRARRRGRATVNVTTSTNRVLAPVGPTVQRIVPVPRIRRRRLGRRGMRLSPDGLAFLKCAFASPDFSVDPGRGIPDEYNGRTVSIKDATTTTVSFAEGKDTYLLVAPVPGYAVFKCEVDIGTQPKSWTGIHYPTYDSNFGPSVYDGAQQTRLSSTNNQFTEFRYASLAIGVYPTSNYMSFVGSIEAYKVDLSLGFTTAAVAGTTEGYQHRAVVNDLKGLEGVTPQSPRDNYAESFIKGVFMMSTDKTGKFDWQPFHYGRGYQNGYPDDNIKQRGIGQEDNSRPLPGLGNLETLVVKVSTPTGAKNTALVKLWNCLELKPQTSSNIYQFSGLSPMHDPVALELYSLVKNRIPVAVCASENAWSWERVLAIIQSIARTTALAPGPLGLVGGGINSVIDGIRGLVV